MEIIISPNAKKHLKKLPSNITNIILNKLYSIKDDPLRHVERLKGSPLWKLRIGDYRAIIFINTSNGTINIVKIGHRKNIYKEL